MATPSAARRGLAIGSALLVVAALAALGGMHLRLFRAPYPALGKQVAWWVGQPEAAYQFDVVEPGRLFRSGFPDARFTDYVRDRYGVERIVSLAGPAAGHARAAELGIPVVEYEWHTRFLPPPEELEAVLDMMREDTPTLVHCGGGTDRTGYAVAFHRVLDEGWPLERAVEEMRRYWHDPQLAPRLHAEMREQLVQVGAAQ